MLLALLSAFSRAGLNLIDRYQIGTRNLSIVVVSFWNNAVLAIAVISVAIVFGFHDQLQSFLMDWKTALFSALVQIVAYTFSNAFRHLNVIQVTIATKAADLFIPIAIFISAGQWDWLTYGFSVITTLICLLILQSDNGWHGRGKRAVVLIVGALVLQAGLAPLLNSQNNAVPDIQQNLLFASAVIVWRLVWCIPATFRCGVHLAMAGSLLYSPVFMSRILLSVMTQVTFVVVVSSSASSVAWPILNSTGLLAMLLSAIILNEKPSGPEKLAITGIMLIAVVRFFTL
jgi:drug/metabolite transporter (DMT)-like permease